MAVAPPILQAGDTVGLVTLGSPLSAATIDARIEVLRTTGLNVVIGNHVYDQDGFLAGTNEERASDLMSMFENEEVKLILATRGGTGVAGILPYLDYDVIRNNPKIVSGYSDITILLNVLYQYADLITLQSLMLIDFAPQTPAYNFDQFFNATSTIQLTRQITNPPGIPQISRIQGNVTGPLVGGNLASFMDSIGTPYEIDVRDKIILLEETHEPTNTIYRYLNHLLLANKLQECAGIVMGNALDAWKPMESPTSS